MILKIIAIATGLIALVAGVYAFEAYNASEAELVASIERQQRTNQAQIAYIYLINLRDKEYDLRIRLGDCLRIKGDCKIILEDLVKIRRQITEQEKRLKELQK